MVRKIPVVLATTLVASACGARLDSVPFKDSSLAENKPLTGVIYHLPATDLVVSVTYELLKCPDPNTQSLAELIRVADISLDMQLVPERTKDGTIVVNQPVGDWFQSIKNAKLTISKDGLLTNADFEASDKLRETLVTAVKLASSIGGLGSLGEKKTFNSVLKQDSFLNCLPEAENLIKARMNVESEIRNASGAPLSNARQNLVNDPGKATKEALEAIESYLAGRQGALATLKEKSKVVDKFRCRPELVEKKFLTDAGLAISEETSGVWWCRPDQFFKSRDLVLAKWFNLGANGKTTIDDTLAAGFRNLVMIAGTDLCVIGSGADCSLTPQKQGSLEAYSGIFYRLPARGIADAYLGSLTRSSGVWSVSFKDVKKLNQFNVDVAHLGRLARIPFKNGPFQDSLTSVKFHPNGAVEEIKYSSTRAIVPDVLGTVNDIRKAPGDAELEKLDREHKLLELRNKLLEQRKKNRELEEAE